VAAASETFNHCLALIGSLKLIDSAMSD